MVANSYSSSNEKFQYTQVYSRANYGLNRIKKRAVSLDIRRQRELFMDDGHFER